MAARTVTLVGIGALLLLWVVGVGMCLGLIALGGGPVTVASLLASAAASAFCVVLGGFIAR